MVWHLGASSKVECATHWKAKAPPDRGGLPLSTERPHPGQEALGPQDPNPGLPPTLHLRTVQGMTREYGCYGLPECTHPEGHRPQTQAPREPSLTPTLGSSPASPQLPPECLRGGKALLGWRSDFFKQPHRVRVPSSPERGNQSWTARSLRDNSV